MSTMSSNTSMMSIQAAHAEAPNLRISLDGELGNLQPDGHEMRFACRKAAMEPEQLDLAAQQQQHGLPPYEALAGKPAPRSLKGSPRRAIQPRRTDKMRARIACWALLLSSAVGVRAADMPNGAAFRRIITLASPSGPMEIVVPPVQGLTYFALRISQHGDELDLQGNVVISVVEAGHSQMTLTAQKASIRRQPLTQEEAAAIVDLESMRVLDQKYRSRPDVTAQDMHLQAELDEADKARLVAIVERLGWPTYSSVGMAAAEAAFLVLQHCADPALQARYLPLLRDAARAGQASLANMALLEDRVRTAQGKPQVYGSQLASVSPPEPKPIEDPEHVDDRRAAVGLEPLADYLKRFEGDSLPDMHAK